MSFVSSRLPGSGGPREATASNVGGKVSVAALGILAVIPIPPVGLPLGVVVGLLLGKGSISRAIPWVGLSALGALSFWVSAELNAAPLSLRAATLTLFIGISALATGRIVGSSLNGARYFLLGVGLAWCISEVFFGSELTRSGLQGLWKFGLATPATLVVLTALAWRSRPAVAIAVLWCSSVISLISEFRSHAIIAFSVGLILLLGQGLKNNRGDWAKLLLTCVVLLGGFLLALAAMQNGSFGEALRDKSLTQQRQGWLVFYTGRSEPPLSLAAISEKPVYGWGSVSEIGGSTVDSGLLAMRNLGASDLASVQAVWLRDGSSVNLHSALFSAWVEGGILAATIYVAVLGCAVVFAVSGARSKQPVYIFLGAIVAWDVLFSPLTPQLAIVFGAILMLTRVGRNRETTRLSARHP